MQSTILNLQSPISNPQSSIFNLQSPILNPQASRPDSFLAGNGPVRGLACAHLRPLPACRGRCLSRQVHRLARLRQHPSIDPSPPEPRRRRGRRRRQGISPVPRRRRRRGGVAPRPSVVVVVARRRPAPMTATMKVMTDTAHRRMGKAWSSDCRASECDCAHEGQECLCRLVHDSPSLSFTCRSHIRVRR